MLKDYVSGSTEARALEEVRISRAPIYASIGARHPFRILKRQFGYLKTRHRGLAKNTGPTRFERSRISRAGSRSISQLSPLFANLVILMAPTRPLLSLQLRGGRWRNPKLRLLQHDARLRVRQRRRPQRP